MKNRKKRSSPNIFRQGMPGRSHNFPREEYVVSSTGPLPQDPAAWLQTNVPALRGPHPSRPWVQVLRALSEAPVR